MSLGFAYTECAVSFISLGHPLPWVFYIYSFLISPAKDDTEIIVFESCFGHMVTQIYVNFLPIVLKDKHTRKQTIARRLMKVGCSLSPSHLGMCVIVAVSV